MDAGHLQTLNRKELTKLCKQHSIKVIGTVFLLTLDSLFVRKSHSCALLVEC